MNSELKKKSLTKLLIYWKEEVSGKAASTFYSLDKDQDLKHNNHLPGMTRLVKRIVEPYKGKYKVAIIYQNSLDNRGEELHRFNSEGFNCERD